MSKVKVPADESVLIVFGAYFRENYIDYRETKTKITPN